MNGLAFENLPAQQDPMGIIQSRAGQTQKYLESQYDNEVNALKTQRLTNQQFNDQVNKINSKYVGIANQERYKISQQTQQLDRIKSLVSAGNITPDAGNEAMMRMVLPQETERAMFPTEKREAAVPQPYSVTQLTSMEESMIDFAERAPDTPGLEWGPPKKTKQGIIDQYNRLRELISYDYQGFKRQNQFDFQWDSLMRGDEKFDAWWSDKDRRTPAVEIQMRRSKGAIGKMMGRRLAGTPMVSANITPMGRSVERKKPKEYTITEMGIPYTFGQPKPEPAEPVPEQMLSRDMALEILRQAGGNKEKARQIAKQKGYKF